MREDDDLPSRLEARGYGSWQSRIDDMVKWNQLLREGVTTNDNPSRS